VASDPSSTRSQVILMARDIYADDVAPLGVPGARAARWSIVLGAVLFAVFAALTVASLTGSAIADDGSWMHLILGLSLLLGVCVAMAAFGMAVTARVQKQTSVLLWLPLLALPGLVAYIALSSRF
jgi:predicted phage tail protein